MNHGADHDKSRDPFTISEAPHAHVRIPIRSDPEGQTALGSKDHSFLNGKSLVDSTDCSRNFRVYEPGECGKDGYPFAWHSIDGGYGVKHLVREQAGHRCVRCLHPYAQGAGEWSPCDERCTHNGPCRWTHEGAAYEIAGPADLDAHGLAWPENLEARWRILTVHHLRLGHDAKRDLRWWNLAALCQRCHLQIQGKVVMERIWPWPHSEWFKPYAAGWYAWTYLGEDVTREQAVERLDELLALERAA